MKRGFFFTVDSMLSIAVVLLLLAALVVLGISGQSSGPEQAILASYAADYADGNFLQLSVTLTPIDADPLTAITASCREVNDYQNNGTVVMRVRKCVKLG